MSFKKFCESSMQISSGLLMYRMKDNEIEVFLIHPGGPFTKKKDEGVWSIPKGLSEPDEDLLKTAKREFKEETGINPPRSVNEYIDLQTVKLGGKIIYSWAFEKDIGDDYKIKSNTFEFVWPKTGKISIFPEADKGEYFKIRIARKKIHPKQISFLKKIENLV